MARHAQRDVRRGSRRPGKPVEITGINFFRHRTDGKIVERIGSFDALGIMQQLGLVAGRLAGHRTDRTDHRDPGDSPDEAPKEANDVDAEEQRNKEIVTEFVKATNKLELDKLDDMVVEDYVDHQPIPGQPPGPRGPQVAYKVFNKPFPDFGFDVRGRHRRGRLVVGRGIGEACQQRRASWASRRPTSRSSGAGPGCSG